MSFLDDLATDLASLTATGGDLSEAITWTVPGFTAFAVPGIVGSTSIDQTSERRSIQADGDHLTVRVVLADIQAAILASSGTSRMPGEGDTCVLRGQTYAVHGARATTGGGCLVTLARGRLTGVGPAWGAA